MPRWRPGCPTTPLITVVSEEAWEGYSLTVSWLLDPECIRLDLLRCNLSICCHNVFGGEQDVVEVVFAFLPNLKPCSP